MSSFNQPVSIHLATTHNNSLATTQNILVA